MLGVSFQPGELHRSVVYLVSLNETGCSSPERWLNDASRDFRWTVWCSRMEVTQYACDSPGGSQLNGRPQFRLAACRFMSPSAAFAIF